MRAIRLEAQEREAPECANFDDESAVVSYERAVREHRAWTSAWSIAPGATITDPWRVQGVEGGAWQVDLVDGVSHDVCDCPDFLSNRLGTCKHLEAVLRAVATRASLRRAFEALPDVPARPTLSLARGERGLTLVALGRWSPSLEARAGITRDRGVRVRDPGRLDELDDARVRVPRAVLRFVRESVRRDALDRRRREVERAVDEGRLRLDVLRSALFPYQVTGVRHLVAAGRALLADDMGLGKTVQAIAACEVLRARGEASRVLIVTAASLKDQWAREIRRHAGASCVVVDGAAPARRAALEGDAPYKILNYEQTWRELQAIQRLDADVLVLDEAQRAKNFRTRTAATLRAIPARFVFALTGTPIENRLDDLYSLMQLVDPEVLGPLWRYNLDFHRQGKKGRVEGYKNLGALRERIAPMLLRRRKEEVLLQLPPITHQTRYVELTDEQRTLEGGYRADAMKWVSIAERRPLTLEERQRFMGLLLKARQACNDIRLCDPERTDDRAPKLDELEALVLEVCAQGGSKVLVFSEWVKMLRLAEERLRAAGVAVLVLHGGIPTEKRPALLARFREDDSIKVLLSTDAGGTGLNLQVASYVIHLDLPWNPGRLDQRTARAHRLGQSRGVSVTYLCAASGIERGIEQTLDEKRALRSAALDLASDVEVVETPSFMATVQQLKGTLAALEGVELAELPAPVAAEAVEEAVADPVEEAVAETVVAEAETPKELEREVIAVQADATPEAVASVAPGAPRNRNAARVDNRLRLAEVVLAAGFPGDAIRAAYEALAGAVGGMLAGEAPPTHAALIAAIYRELAPAGRCPPGLHATLARLHDLTSLDAQGVPVDESLARESVAEAAAWVARVG